jgi:hypothetical protein
MTDARTKQVPEIEALLAERKKYEQWLAQLDARKDATPAHVFVKVHADYTARLAEAQAKLSAESAAVSAMAAQMEESLAKHEKQISDRADERAEAELRAAVGEFGAKEWDKLRTKLDSAIADLSTERDGIQRERDTLRALLTETAPVEKAPEPVAPAALAAPAAKSEAAVPLSPDANESPKGDVDDIAFLRSVLGRSTPYSSTPAPAPAPAISEPPTGGTSGRASGRASVPVEKRPSQSAPAIADSETKPAPVRASVPVAAPVAAPAPEPVIDLPAMEVLPAYEPNIPDTPRASGSARASGATARPSTGSSVVQPRLSVPELFATPEVPEDPSGPRGSNDHKPSRPSGTFGQATPRTSEAVKSLKCQECGTLNYPTEWYCERCGGELAAF